MSDKKAKEMLLYQDVFRYLTERSYRQDADNEWKRTIRRNKGSAELHPITVKARIW